VDTRVLFYRRDLLEQAGWREMPTTWAEWRKAMEGIKRVVGPERFAIFLPTNEFVPEQILGQQAGSPLLGDGGTRGVFSGPEFRRAFDFYLALFRDGLAPPIGYNEISNMYQEFERGYFAMVITGPWNLGEFKRRLSEERQDDWDTAPMPGPDGPGVSVAGGASLVVFRKGRRQDDAWRLVEFLSRPEQQVRFYELTGDLPARLEAWRHGDLASDPKLAAFEEQLTRVVPSPQVPEWELVARKLQDTAERAVRGSVPADAALAALDREVWALLEKRRWMLERRRPEAAGVGTR
jgi:multiple sugar transport system substrate-binding protein